jgi:disulfide bond formation protein DsbB
MGSFGLREGKIIQVCIPSIEFYTIGIFWKERKLTRKKFILISLAFFVVGFLLTACGGDSGASEITPPPPTDIPPADTPSGPTYSPEQVSEGEDLYAANCSACHGADATGVQGLGKGLRNNDFVQGKTDDALMEFIEVGRSADDPLNTTGVIMPPKGGNPAMTDEQIGKIIAFLRSLQ